MELSSKTISTGKSFESDVFYVVKVTTDFYISYIDSFQIILQ